MAIAVAMVVCDREACVYMCDLSPQRHYADAAVTGCACLISSDLHLFS